MTFYHGTDFSNVPSIAKQGLKLDSGAKWSNITINPGHAGAVYLTNDFEKAARYAIGAMKDQIPVVLEVVISTPRRFNAMRDDPLDKSDNAWEDDSGENRDTESFRDLDRIVEKTINSIIAPEKKYFRSIIHQFDTLQELDGVNLYKMIADFIPMITKRLSRNDIMARLVKLIPAGDLVDFMELRRDGTMKLTAEYWESREQLFYQKGVPSSAIKFAWVRVDDFTGSEYIEKVKAGVKLLPSESKERYDDILGILDEVSSWDHGEKSAEDYEEWSNAATAAGYPDIAVELDKLALTDSERRSEESEAINDDMRERASWIQGDDHYQDVVENEVVWGKVPFKDVGGLIKTSDGHPILPGLVDYMTGKGSQ